MNKILRTRADEIAREAIEAVLPDEAVIRALEGRTFPGRVVLIAAGKAGWQMAKTACDLLGDRLSHGVVITKYGHVKGDLPRVICCEAGHPVPDENSFRGTAQAMAAVEGLTETDTVLFLLSGGGSALFEQPLISGELLQSTTEKLLAGGADIVEINTVRKRLSAVKGGKFALLCGPARVVSVILSDVVEGSVDLIASGPTCPDTTTCDEAMAVAKKYGLSEELYALLQTETPRELPPGEVIVSGSVAELCRAAAEACRRRGYAPIIVNDRLSSVAREEGARLGQAAAARAGEKVALILGGETVVHVTGTGLGGRNQELALSAAPYLDGKENVCVFSVGSDGTDGPTDAAGGYVDEDTVRTLTAAGLTVDEILADNDAYHGLEATGGLIITGPTGTNVNDLTVALLSL